MNALRKKRNITLEQMAQQLWMTVEELYKIEDCSEVCDDDFAEKVINTYSLTGDEKDDFLEHLKFSTRYAKAYKTYEETMKSGRF